MTETIIKRDGRKAAFEPEKIRKSISRAFHDSGRTPGETDIAQLTGAVVDALPREESVNVDAIYETVFTTLKRRASTTLPTAMPPIICAAAASARRTAA